MKVIFIQVMNSKLLQYTLFLMCKLSQITLLYKKNKFFIR
jgi:hypothetical protein